MGGFLQGLGDFAGGVAKGIETQSEINARDAEAKAAKQKAAREQQDYDKAQAYTALSGKITPDMEIQPGDTGGTVAARLIDQYKQDHATPVVQPGPIGQLGQKVASLFSRNDARTIGQAAGVGAPPAPVGLPATAAGATDTSAAAGAPPPAAPSAPAAAPLSTAGLPSAAPTPGPTAPTPGPTAPAAGLPSTAAATGAPAPATPDTTTPDTAGGVTVTAPSKKMTPSQYWEAQMTLAGQYGTRADVMDAATKMKDALTVERANRYYRMNPHDLADDLSQHSGNTVTTRQNADGETVFDIRDADGKMVHSGASQEEVVNMAKSYADDNAAVGWSAANAERDHQRAEVRLDAQTEQLKAQTARAKAETQGLLQQQAQGRKIDPLVLQEAQRKERLAQQAEDDSRVLSNTANVWGAGDLSHNYMAALSRNEGNMKDGHIYKQSTTTDQFGNTKVLYQNQLSAPANRATYIMKNSPYAKQQVIRQAQGSDGNTYFVVMDPKDPQHTMATGKNGQPVYYTDWRDAQNRAALLYPKLVGQDQAVAAAANKAYPDPPPTQAPDQQ